MSEVVNTQWTLAYLRTQRNEILTLAQQHGAFNVRVFGSVARGEATEQSDIDLLVTVKPKTSVFDLVGLWLDLKDLLGCDVSLVSDGIDDSRFLQRIQDDLIAL